MTSLSPFGQDLDSAKEFFKRRIEYVQEQLEKIEMMGIEKSKIRDTIREVICSRTILATYSARKRHPAA